MAKQLVKLKVEIKVNKQDLFILKTIIRIFWVHLSVGFPSGFIIAAVAIASYACCTAAA
jgi:hypothetical protein